MNHSNPEDRRPHNNFLYSLSMALTGGAAIVAIVVGFGLMRSGDRFLGMLANLVVPPQPAPQVDIKSVVVQQVRGVSELTTAVYTLQTVVPTKRDRTVAGYVVGTTTLLYIAHGEVRAGIDLSQVSQANVESINGTIRLKLPPPQILDSKIDVNRSSVYDYDRGFLGLGPDVAPELQQLAERQTLQTIVASACEQGILQEANDRARLVVSQLLTTAGHGNAVVETQVGGIEECRLVNADERR